MQFKCDLGIPLNTSFMWKYGSYANPVIFYGLGHVATYFLVKLDDFKFNIYWLIIHCWMVTMQLIITCS